MESESRKHESGPVAILVMFQPVCHCAAGASVPLVCCKWSTDVPWEFWESFIRVMVGYELPTSSTVCLASFLKTEGSLT